MTKMIWILIIVIAGCLSYQYFFGEEVAEKMDRMNACLAKIKGQPMDIMDKVRAMEKCKEELE